jgi:hypothetical protein
MHCDTKACTGQAPGLPFHPSGFAPPEKESAVGVAQESAGSHRQYGKFILFQQQLQIAVKRWIGYTFGCRQPSTTGFACQMFFGTAKVSSSNRITNEQNFGQVLLISICHPDINPFDPLSDGLVRNKK